MLKLIHKLLALVTERKRKESTQEPMPDRSPPESPTIAPNVNVHLVHPDPPEPAMMQLSEKAIKLLIKWEGLELRPYRDSVGKWTVGIGHLMTEYPFVVLRGKRIDLSGNNALTIDQVMELKWQDAERFEKAVNDSVTVPLTQDQFDALVIFAFNVGEGAFKSSMLLKELNNGKYEAVPKQMMRWNKGTIDGKKVEIDGLTNRRENEIRLYNGEIT